MLRTPARIDTSSIDTGSSARISFGCDRERLGEADPLALAAAHLVRESVEHLGGLSPTVSQTRSASRRRSAGSQLRPVQREIAHDPVRDPEAPG